MKRILIIASIALLILPGLVGASETESAVACVEQPAPTTLHWGDHTECMIETPTDVDTFAIAASGADLDTVLRINVVPTGGSLCPWVSVYNPAGELIHVNGCTLADDLPISTTGSYVIVVSDVDLTNTGSYALHVERIPPVTLSPMTFGQSRFDSIDNPADADVFVFQGTEGIEVRINVVPTGGSLCPWVSVYNPEGGLIHVNGCDLMDDIPISATGAYTVLVSDVDLLNTGNYSLEVVCLSPMCPPNPAEQCSDGIDNDCDGLADDADPDCSIWPDSATAQASTIYRSMPVEGSSIANNLLSLLVPAAAILALRAVRRKKK